MAVPQELMFQNQLLFNLNVPLTTHNMATHFHRPPPITIHRSAAAAPNHHHAFPLAQLENRHNTAGGGGAPPTSTSNPDFQFSVLSQDRMAAAVQLAKRDLKNQKHQEGSVRGGRSPSPPLAVKQHQQKLIYGTRQWENRRSRAPTKKTMGGRGSAAVGRGKKMVVQDRNRIPRSARSHSPDSSTPPPHYHSSSHRQAFINTKVSPERPGGSESPGPPTRDTPSLTRVSQQPTDDIERLQLEMELCLQQIESVQTRALSEHNTDFLRPQSGKTKSERQRQRECNMWLRGDDDDEGRRKERAKEQSHRSLRTIYNLRQQLKEMERQALKLPRDCRATKKSQASQRLVMVNKGAVKLLQSFVSQLPHQDLRSGLPSHFSELADLVRQVTLLSAGVAPPALSSSSAQQDSGKKARESSGNKASSLSGIEADVMAMVDHVERLNYDWQRDAISRMSAPAHSNKPPFVTSFKNKSAFTKEQIGHSELQEKLHSERKAMLQEGFRALLKKANLSVNKKTKAEGAWFAGKREGGGGGMGAGGRSKGQGNPYKTLMVPPRPPPPMAPHNPFRYKKAPPTRKPRPARKGYLLPAKVRTQRAREQRQPSKGASVSSTHFADPTITANLKASYMLHNSFITHRSTSEPPSAHHKKVNFIPPYAAGHSHHASYPGARLGRDHHDHYHDHQSSTPTRLSRSHSPRVHFSTSHSGHGGRQRNFSDSECYSPTGESSGAEEEEESWALGGASSTESLAGRYRSRGGQGSSGHRLRAGSPSSQRRRFFVTDADPELVGELFPEDRHRPKTRQGSHTAKTHKTQPQREDTRLGPYMDEVENRVRQKLAQLTRDHQGHGDKPDVDSVADAILQEAILEATEEVTELERRAAAAERASAHVDNPTLENIMQALDNMEKENERMRQKYCSVTFHDSVPRHRRYQKSSQVFAEFLSDQPREPPAFEVRNTRPPVQESEALPREFPSELSQEPLIFTKESKAPRAYPTLIEHHPGHHHQPPPPPTSRKNVPPALRPKTLLSMKQTVVERIADGVERFDYYQRGLKQHLGKHRPFDLYERVADSVLWQCCAEVAQELESINADMADNIYTSEFLSDTGLPLAPPQLAPDFFLAPGDNTGTAAQNLRDSALAQRTVEAAVSRTVTSLMLPPEEPELSALSPRRMIGTDDDDDAASPRWDTSLKHVYDATALYEASVTADKPAGAAATSVASQQGKGGGGGGVKEDDTHVEEYDYDDDYTDISDDDDEDDDKSGDDDEGDDYDDDDFDEGTGSPSP